jgi:hypothetical protein
VTLQTELVCPVHVSFQKRRHAFLTKTRPTKTPHAVRWLACGALITVAIVGCGKQTGPRVQFVKGVVTLGGQPLEGATVSLTPKAGSTGLPAFGMTKSGGDYVLTSSRGGAVNAGAVAGDYLVTVKKMQVVTEADIGILITRQEYERQMRENAGLLGFQPEAPVVPKAYGSAETSGLRVTVKQGRNTGPEFSFDLRPDFKGE